MATSATHESTADNQHCYCLNPACQQPKNLVNALLCQNCGSQLLLKDRYRAIKPIGQGGFGRTFQGVDESRKSQVNCAIKQFFPQQQGTNNIKKAAELFHQEATRLEALGSHPRIPKLLAYFEQEQHYYLVQEFINGQNLAQELAEKGTFQESEIRQLLTDLLPVLEFVHANQVIHRDIKPENIIRRYSDSTLVLVDFGAAKYTTETTLGKTGTTIGSAAYTAPEQVRGKAVFASDIYSLGVTCIHLLTQIPPFDLFDSGENTWVWRDYLRQTNTSVRHQLGEVLDKMLQGATNRRYQSAKEVLKDLNVIATPKAALKSKKPLIAAGIILLGLAGFYYLKPRPQPVTMQQPTEVVMPELETPAPRLLSKNPGLYVQGQQQVFPLQHTEVVAKISGNVSRVEVTQTFNNPFKDPLEAVYVFPLPDEAAVDDMEIKVGDRIIR